jgi:hypothetical protein
MLSMPRKRKSQYEPGQHDAAYWRERLLAARPPDALAPIRRFPRPLVVPPFVPPFDKLELDQASAGFPFTEPREYGLRLAPIDDVDSNGGVLVTGEVGRAFMIPERNPDPGGDPAHRRLQRPRPEAEPPETLLIEQFFGLRVRSALAWVQHTQGAHSSYEEWSISWFEPVADATYTINLYNAIARQLTIEAQESGEFGPSKRLAALAAESFQLRLT